MSAVRPEPHDQGDHQPSTAITTPPTAVRVQGLTVELPSRDRPYAAPIRAVRELDLSVPAGQVTALVGTNGAGKTTTLRTVIGALPWAAGSIEVLGTEMGAAGVALPAGVAVVPDTPDYPDRWTARTVARAHSTVGLVDPALFEARLTAHQVPLDRPVGRLSRGQLTQLAISAALAQDPRLLILDEPLARLDPLARTELVDELRDLMAHDTRTLLLSTHDLEGMDRFVDHLVVIADGRAVLEGDVETLCEEFLLVEQAREAKPSGESGPDLIGPTAAGGTTRGLVAVDDAAGQDPEASLRRPTMSELVTHCLRAADTSVCRAPSPATTSRRGAE